MNPFRSSAAARRRASAASPPRRAFLRRAGLAGATAAGAGLVTAGAAEARPPANGIVPGTVVDERGRPMTPPPGTNNPYVGEIMAVGFNFAPRGWALCNGQLLAISSNDALFSLLGTIYGGDGRTTFGLPDLRGRVAIGMGDGPGLTSRQIGQKGGAENVALTVNQIPSHTHTQPVKQAPATSPTPQGLYPAADVDGDRIYSNAATTTQLAPSTATGGGQPHNNLPPQLGCHYVIALFGTYPSRS